MAIDGETKDIEQYRCEKCNAPYPLGADDVIATCPYCGFTFTVGGDEIGRHLLLPNKLSPDEVVDVVKMWLSFAAGKSVGRGIMDQVEIETPDLRWIPFFRVRGNCQTYHLGGKKEKRGNRTVWKKIERSENEEAEIWVIARRHAATFGVEEYIETFQGLATEDFDISSTEAPVLNAEIGEEDANPRALYRKSEEDRVHLQEELDRLFDYRINMDVTDRSYTHAPYWLVRYNYMRGTFRVAVSGATGEVILGELPVTKLYRMKRWLTSIVMFIASALLFQALPYATAIILQSSTDSEALLVPVLLFGGGAFLWVAGLIFLGHVLRYEVTLTASGKEREDAFDFTDSVSSLGRRRR
ncbi:MAG: hypothetical protein JSW61_15255 [Candidatus Thorarchaeota archaeon]|nr:MAG: hypothetical protein JSW61_15255 [Candidatus Thorarchaeota archaeon]